RLAHLGRGPARPLVRARGSEPPRTGPARVLGGGGTRRWSAPARDRRPPRRRTRRADEGGRLQDGADPGRGLRGQGALPDEVLRARPLADARTAADAPPAGLSR